MQLKPAIFLDRDGVLNEDKGYTHRVEDLVVLPGVASTLRKLQNHGFLLLVVTNQSGVARGMFSLPDVHEFHRALSDAVFKESGAVLNSYYICPHFQGGSVGKYSVDCECRKPKTGLVEQAQKEHGIDMASSWLVGDRDCDILCGQAAGLKTIRLKNPKYEWPKDLEPTVTINQFADLAALTKI